MGSTELFNLVSPKPLGDLIVTIDEDLQHDPADILRLIEKQKERDYDVVYGKFTNPQHDGIRNIISALLRKNLKIFIPTLYEEYSPYRLIKHDIAVRTSTMVCPFTFIDDFLSRVTQNIGFVDVTHSRRFSGRSSYTFSKFVKLGIHILLAYSRIVTLLLFSAFLIMFAGIFLLIINTISPDSIFSVDLNSIAIFGIFGTGMLLMILSLSGTFLNSRNIKLNTRPVKLSDEDTF